MKRSNRSSNFELLRIIAMLFIVCHHSALYGLLNGSVGIQGGNPVPNQLWNITFTGQVVAMFGKAAVDIYVMISGYFLINSKTDLKKSFKKVLFLLAQVYFYSVLIYLVAVHFNWVNPNDPTVLSQAFLPIIYNTNWFATEYLMLYLIYPFINASLHSITRKQHYALILIGVFVFSFIQMIFPNFMTYGSYGFLTIFVLFYVIGAYFRMYSIRHEKLVGCTLFMGGSLILVGILYYYDVLAKTTNNQQYYSRGFSFAGQYSLIPLLIAAGLVMIFKNINIGSNRVINTISATTFGIYLIHDNPIMEEILWKHFLNVPALYLPNSKPFLKSLIIIVPLVFVCCSLIDYVRILIFNLVSKIYLKVKNHVKC